MHTTELFQCAIFIMLSQSDLNQTFHLILYFDGRATTIKLKELVDCLIKSNGLFDKIKQTECPVLFLHSSLY